MSKYIADPAYNGTIERRIAEETGVNYDEIKGYLQGTAEMVEVEK